MQTRRAAEGPKGQMGKNLLYHTRPSKLAQQNQRTLEKSDVIFLSFSAKCC